MRLAARAADEMVAGRTIELAELVVSLRTFIRDVLDLDPIPAALTIPKQGPLRSAAGSRGGGGERAGGSGAGLGAGAVIGGIGVSSHADPLDPDATP